MVEKKSKQEDQESSEFTTQKIDPEKLMAEQSKPEKAEQATQKIDDRILEAAVAKEPIDSSATMKVSEAELKQAMEEETGNAAQGSTPPGEKKPSVVIEESPPIEAPVEKKEPAVSKINPTVATILGVALVLAACICSCAFVIVAVVYMSEYM